MEMVKMKISHISGIGSAAQSLDETMGNAGHTAEMDMAVRRNVADRFISCNEVQGLHKKSILIFVSAKIVKKQCTQKNKN